MRLHVCAEERERAGGEGGERENGKEGEERGGAEERWMKRGETDGQRKDG